MKKILLVNILFVLLTASAESQDSIQFNARESRLNKNQTIFIVGGIIVYSASLYPLTKFVWHHNHDRTPFHFYYDFKANLQVDKFQHVFLSYDESYIGYHLLRSMGVPKGKSLLFGGTWGFILQTPKEFIDGFYEPGGFSWGDAISNGIGSAFFIGQEALFDEQVVKLKSSFTRSRYADLANGYMGWTYVYGYFHDYNGHTHWLSVNANKIFLKKTLPPWISIAAGYSANGVIGDFKNLDSYQGVIIPETPRYRQYLLSLDIDWSKINTKSKFLKVLFQGLNFIKIPFPALEYNSLGQWKGYWFYF